MRYARCLPSALSAALRLRCLRAARGLVVGTNAATQITRIAQTTPQADNARQRSQHGPFLAQQYGMSNDEKGATEEDMQKIDVIRGAEVLGYEGAGREEHSGENSPTKSKDQRDELADNKPEDLR